MRSVRALILPSLLMVLVLAGCGAVPATVVIDLGEATPDLSGIVQATFHAMTAQAPVQPSTTPLPATSSVTSGSISGSLNYPSESLPAMHITAYEVGTQNYRYVTTSESQSTYQISDLAPGTYHVVAYTVGSASFPPGLAGGYTQAVLCGLTESCNDHTLAGVQVGGGQAVTGINPADWYLVEDAFPPFPGAQGGPASMAGIDTTGAIAGSLMYPSSGIPAMRIVASDVSSSAFHYVDAVAGQRSYVLQGLPPGIYHVVAYVKPEGGFPPGLAGGYSQMVPCGLKYGCDDHALIDVVVAAGAVTNGVDPIDFYVDPAAFPPNPAP